MSPPSGDIETVYNARHGLVCNTAPRWERGRLGELTRVDAARFYKMTTFDMSICRLYAAKK